MTTYSENHKTIIYGCPSCFETSEAGQWIDGKCPNCGWIETIERKNAKLIDEIEADIERSKSEINEGWDKLNKSLDELRSKTQELYNELFTK